MTLAVYLNTAQGAWELALNLNQSVRIFSSDLCLPTDFLYICSVLVHENLSGRHALQWYRPLPRQWTAPFRSFHHVISHIISFFSHVNCLKKLATTLPLVHDIFELVLQVCHLLLKGTCIHINWTGTVVSWSTSSSSRLRCRSWCLVVT